MRRDSTAQTRLDMVMRNNVALAILKIREIREHLFPLPIDMTFPCLGPFTFPAQRRIQTVIVQPIIVLKASGNKTRTPRHFLQTKRYIPIQQECKTIKHVVGVTISDAGFRVTVIR